MENMRWILLLIGILLIIGIYVAGRLQSREPKPRKRRLKRGSIRRKAAPDFAIDELESMEPMRFDEDHSTRAGNNPDSSPAPGPAETVFSLLVTAPTSVPFRGPVLQGALAMAKLEFGDMQIFHRTEMVDGRERILFSLANIREPGTFDLSAMDDFTTEGLALFMQVHGGVDAVRAFDAMIESARILADNLDGHICDARRSALTQQTIHHMREEVINCQLQQRVAQTAS
jgi:cell division protein ZipA